MIKLIITDEQIKISELDLLTSGTVGKEIEVDASCWDYGSIIAVFTNGTESYDSVVVDDKVTIPWELMTEGAILTVGFYAAEIDTTGRSPKVTRATPTIYCELGEVVKGAVPSGAESADRTATLAEQIASLINAIPSALPNPYAITINGTSYDGTAPVTMTIEGGGSANAVLYTAQTLTDSQKTQTRTNIGAGTSSFDGAYSSLSGTPTIPTKTSELTNDSGFLTSHQSLSAYRTSAAQDVIDNSKVAKGELVYNVKDYGATGDGVTDDTAAINSCITAAGNNSTIYFPAGTYAVHSVSGTYNAISLVGKSNVEVLLADGAKIENLIETIDSNRTINYRTLLIQNCTNISIRGGTIKGELSKHGTDPQSTDDIHGYGIRIQNSGYVTVVGCALSDYYGDPIMIVEATGETNSHITIRNCRITDSFRNGVSVCGVTDAVIEGCYISGMTGALPKAGIDVEPESGTNANIIIRNCNVQNADYHAVEVVTGTTGTIIENCILNGETVIENTARDTTLRDSELRYLTSAGGNVEGCTIARCTMRTDKTKFVNCVFDPTISDYTASNIYVLQYESTAASGAVFEHCVFNDNVSSSASAIFFRNDVSSTKNQSTEFRHCTFYLNAKGAGGEVLSEHYYLNMDSCTIVANSAAITNQFFTASSSTGTAVVTNCVFDMRACTSASDYSSIVKLNYANLTVMNCSMIFGATVPSYWQYPYSTNGTGVIKFIGNHIPAFSTVGRFQSTPTTKVLYGNILSSTTDWSGSYDELSNKPTIPSAVTESTVSGWGFTKNTGTVSSLADLSITATATELNYCDGVTSNIQTQLDGKLGEDDIDTTPTSGSSNLITSGAVYTAIGDVESALEALL